MNKEEIIREHEEKKRFKKYRERIVSRLPIYAEAIFSFRKIGYRGCGFHYSLEKNLGNVISLSQDIDRLYTPDKEKRFMDRILLEIIVAELARNIARIKMEKGLI